MPDTTGMVYTPTTVHEALRILADGGAGIRPLAGGTDAMVKYQEGLWRPLAWLNLGRLRGELAYIRQGSGLVEIGALTTLSELLDSPLIQDAAPLLIKAVRTIGGPQIRNMATLGGNIGTASPAGDSLPALQALEARVRLVSPNGEREIDIQRLVLGPGRCSLRPGELISSIVFARQAADELCTYEKLGLRAAHAIAIASSALRFAPDSAGTSLRLARVALGSVAPTVIRVSEAEAILTHSAEESAPSLAHTLMPRLASVAEACCTAAHPISDIRASAFYRRQMAGNLVIRGIMRLFGVQPSPAVPAN